MAKAKTPKQPKAPKAAKAPKAKAAPAPKVEKTEWELLGEKLETKKAEREAGKIPGYEFNAYIKPLIDLHEQGNRGDVLKNSIHQL